MKVVVVGWIVSRGLGEVLEMIGFSWMDLLGWNHP